MAVIAVVLCTQVCCTCRDEARSREYKDEDSHASHKLEDLHIHYPPMIFQYYDMASMGFRESVTLLASEI